MTRAARACARCLSPPSASGGSFKGSDRRGDPFERRPPARRRPRAVRLLDDGAQIERAVLRAAQRDHVGAALRDHAERPRPAVGNLEREARAPFRRTDELSITLVTSSPLTAAFVFASSSRL